MTTQIRLSVMPRMTASATAPTSTVAQLTSPSDRIHDASSPQAVSPDVERPGQLGQLPDDDVDRGAGQEACDDRPG